MTSDELNLKKIVAEKAVELFVKDGMTVGLGTGSTAYYAIMKIGELVNDEGFELTCVATSEKSEQIALDCGINVVSINDVEKVDVTIDGADEVDPKLNLIKGLGGALLREKVVAAASISEVIIVDESKLVDTLGTKAPLPVEVLSFGHSFAKNALKRQGCNPVLRMKEGVPFITDGGNMIYDCEFKGIDSPLFLEGRVNVIPGVVDNGLFLNMTEAVLVSHKDGSVELITKEGKKTV